MAQFTNQATLTYNGLITNSNIVVGELTEVLNVTKTPLFGTYSRGGTVTYLVSIVNSGTTEFNGLTLTDNLGEYALESGTKVVPHDYISGSVKYYLNGVLQAAPAVTAGPPLVISGISVPAGGNTTVVYEARVNSLAPLNSEGQITNTVTVNGEGLINPITDDATVSATAEPALSITKALCPQTVAENGQLTYTFYIQNTGNTAIVAADNVTISDTFDPVINIRRVTFNDAEWTATTDYTYNRETGEFQSVVGKITVPAATYTQNPTTGVWTVTPGVSTLTITGTI